jgi:hypothetical protein
MVMVSKNKQGAVGAFSMLWMRHWKLHRSVFCNGFYGFGCSYTLSLRCNEQIIDVEVASVYVRHMAIDTDLFLFWLGATVEAAPW